MNFIDTHCHIHESDYPLDPIETLNRARVGGVTRLVCVGATEQSSREAVEFAGKHDGVFAAIGVHPHEVKKGWEEIENILSSSLTAISPFQSSSTLIPSPTSILHQTRQRPVISEPTSLSAAELATLKQSSLSQEVGSEMTGLTHNGASLEDGGGSTVSSIGFMRSSEQNEKEGPNNHKIVAIGEIGLDYFYMHSPREVQIMALEAQIDLARKHNLPIIFHVREAFYDFWPIIDNFHGIRGELHSFTDTTAHLEEGLKRGFFIGINGISTFTKDTAQKAMFAQIPLDRMLLETDAPFLTPVPFRGKVNEPAFVWNIAEQIALDRGISIEEVAAATTANARALFALR